MKYSYSLIIALIIVNISLAQSDLFVSNGSYVFVDGVGFDDTVANTVPLYVEDDINLANGGNIYLRNEAQIIQGDEAERNIGLGDISIYQEGTVNRWAYNYWCSPVGLTSVTAANGDFDRFNMQEVTGLRTSQNFNFLGTGQFSGDDTTNPVSIANAWFYTFTTSDDYSEWNSIETGTAAPGLGFTMKGTNGNSGSFDPDTQGQRIDFRGKANTGTIDIPVLEPVADPTDIDGDGLTTEYQWTLSGNPYPSALDAGALLWDSENLGPDGIAGTTDDISTGSLYFWDQDIASNSHFINDYVGGYATLTVYDPSNLPNLNAPGLVSAVAATWFDYDSAGNIDIGPLANPNMRVPTQFLPVGQGFMVEGLNDGDFKIKNSHRVFQKEAAGQSILFGPNNDTQLRNNTNTDSSENLLTDEGYSIIHEDYKRFRLFIEFNELYTRELLQNFHANATDGFDYGLEAKSPKGVASDACWILNDVPYVIQAHNFDESLKIPLVINITETQPLNFRLADVQHFAESLPIYLHDKENNLYVDLREANYDMILDIGDYTDRFEITFSKETLGLTETDLNNFKVLQNNTIQELTVLNPNSLDIKSVSLIDISGKQIFKTNELPIQTRHTFSTSNLSEGVYIATISLDNKQTISEKVIISNKQ